MMKLLLLVCLLFSNIVFANDFAFEAGIRQQSVDTTVSGVNMKSGSGFQFGGTAHLQFSPKLFLRTGMLYTQRPFSYETSGSETKVSANYLDIPLALLMKFEEYAGVFVGVHVALNMDASASPTVSNLNPKSPLVPLVFGFNFKMAPQIGGTLYYENASGDAFRNFSNSRAVGVNLMVTFD